jgi:hypothetical protein
MNAFPFPLALRMIGCTDYFWIPIVIFHPTSLRDLMTIIASIMLFLLIIFTKQADAKKQMVILGILGYLFYAYGIFVYEGRPPWVSLKRWPVAERDASPPLSAHKSPPIRLNLSYQIVSL